MAIYLDKEQKCHTKNTIIVVFELWYFFFMSIEFFLFLFLIGMKFLNSYHNTVLKAQRTIHPLKKAFDGFKSCCSGFLCFEDLTDYLVKLKPKHNTSLSLLILSLALRSGEERQNTLEEDGVNTQNKDLWSSDKIWMRSCQEKHETYHVKSPWV